jgi:NADPH2:quinone reductase
LVRDKGAFASLKYQAKNLRSKVMEVTEGKGVSIIFDAVGGDIFNESLKWYTQTCSFFLFCLK